MAWREIAQKMHLGKSLKVSLAEVKGDLLFWQREVYEKISLKFLPQQQHDNNVYNGGKGSHSYPQIDRSRKGKGKKGEGKGKGKKGKD